MIKFLLTYTDTSAAKFNNWPRAGSIIGFDNTNEILDFVNKHGQVIVHPLGWEPHWAFWHSSNSFDENKEDHVVDDLVNLDDKEFHWLEVYNNMRE